MNIFLLILHGLAALALLGALTHQLAALLRIAGQAGSANGKHTFVGRYARVQPSHFTRAITFLYAACFILGAIIYPVYRIEVRIPFEEMGMFWAVGVFEIKEHWGGIGLGLLPWYWWLWTHIPHDAEARSRLVVTSTLCLIVWADFLAGHVLNNIRGLP